MENWGNLCKTDELNPSPYSSCDIILELLHWEKLGEGHKQSLYHFLQLHKNLQLSQNIFLILGISSI